MTEIHPLLENKMLNKINKSKILIKIKMLLKDGLNFDRHGLRKRKIINLFKINPNLRKLSVNFHYNSENSRKVEKQPLSSSTIFNQQPQQKISDRIQEKLNIIKNGYETKTVVPTNNNDMIKRRDHTPITGKKIKSTVSNEKNSN